MAYKNSNIGNFKEPRPDRNNKVNITIEAEDNLRSETVDSQLDDKSARIESNESPVSSKVESQEQPVSLLIETKEQAVSSSIEAKDQEISSRVENQEQIVSSRIEAQDQPISSKVESNESPMSSRIETQEQSISSKIESQDSPISSTIQNKEQETSSRIESSEQSVSSSVEAKVQEVSSRIESQEQTVSSAIASKEQETSSRIEAQEQLTSSKVENTEQSISSSIENKVQEMSSRVESQESPVSSSIATKEQETSSRVESAEQAVSTSIATQESSVSSKVESTEQLASTSIDAQTSPISSNIENKYQDVSNRVESSTAPMSVKIERKGYDTIKVFDPSFVGNNMINSNDDKVYIKEAENISSKVVVNEIHPAAKVKFSNVREEGTDLWSWNTETVTIPNVNDLSSNSLSEAGVWDLKYRTIGTMPLSGDGITAVVINDASFSFTSKIILDIEGTMDMLFSITGVYPDDYWDSQIDSVLENKSIQEYSGNPEGSRYSTSVRYMNVYARSLDGMADELNSTMGIGKGNQITAPFSFGLGGSFKVTFEFVENFILPALPTYATVVLSSANPFNNSGDFAHPVASLHFPLVTFKPDSDYDKQGLFNMSGRRFTFENTGISPTVSKGTATAELYSEAGYNYTTSGVINLKGKDALNYKKGNITKLSDNSTDDGYTTGGRTYHNLKYWEITGANGDGQKVHITFSAILIDKSQQTVPVEIGEPFYFGGQAVYAIVPTDVTVFGPGISLFSGNADFNLACDRFPAENSIDVRQIWEDDIASLSVVKYGNNKCGFNFTIDGKTYSLAEGTFTHEGSFSSVSVNNTLRLPGREYSFIVKVDNSSYIISCIKNSSYYVLRSSYTGLGDMWLVSLKAEDIDLFNTKSEHDQYDAGYPIKYNGLYFAVQYVVSTLPDNVPSNSAKISAEPVSSMQRTTPALAVAGNNHYATKASNSLFIRNDVGRPYFGWIKDKYVNKAHLEISDQNILWSDCQCLPVIFPCVIPFKSSDQMAIITPNVPSFYYSPFSVKDKPANSDLTVNIGIKTGLNYNKNFAYAYFAEESMHGCLHTMTNPAVLSIPNQNKLFNATKSSDLLEGSCGSLILLKSKRMTVGGVFDDLTTVNSILGTNFTTFDAVDGEARIPLDGSVFLQAGPALYKSLSANRYLYSSTTGLLYSGDSSFDIDQNTGVSIPGGVGGFGSTFFMGMYTVGSYTFINKQGYCEITYKTEQETVPIYADPGTIIEIPVTVGSSVFFGVVSEEEIRVFSIARGGNVVPRWKGSCKDNTSMMFWSGDYGSAMFFTKNDSNNYDFYSISDNAVSVVHKNKVVIDIQRNRQGMNIGQPLFDNKKVDMDTDKHTSFTLTSFDIKLPERQGQRFVLTGLVIQCKSLAGTPSLNVSLFDSFSNASITTTFESDNSGVYSYTVSPNINLQSVYYKIELTNIALRDVFFSGYYIETD